MFNNGYNFMDDYPYLSELANRMQNYYYNPYTLYQPQQEYYGAIPIGYTASDFSVGLSDVRKKLIEDIKAVSQNMKAMFQQPPSQINGAEIGGRLGRGDIHPSSSTGSSL